MENNIDLDDNITVRTMPDDEYFPIVGAFICNDGILDNDCMYLKLMQ